MLPTATMATIVRAFPKNLCLLPTLTVVSAFQEELLVPPWQVSIKELPKAPSFTDGANYIPRAALATLTQLTYSRQVGHFPHKSQRQ